MKKNHGHIRNTAHAIISTVLTARISFVKNPSTSKDALLRIGESLIAMLFRDLCLGYLLVRHNYDKWNWYWKAEVDVFAFGSVIIFFCNFPTAVFALIATNVFGMDINVRYGYTWGFFAASNRDVSFPFLSPIPYLLKYGIDVENV